MTCQIRDISFFGGDPLSKESNDQADDEDNTRSRSSFEIGGDAVVSQ